MGIFGVDYEIFPVEVVDTAVETDIGVRGDTEADVVGLDDILVELAGRIHSIGMYDEKVAPQSMDLIDLNEFRVRDALNLDSLF